MFLLICCFVGLGYKNMHESGKEYGNKSNMTRYGIYQENARNLDLKFSSFELFGKYGNLSVS